MGKLLNNLSLDYHPIVLCTWFEGGKWHTYEMFAMKTDDEGAIEEAHNTVWGKHPTFQAVIVDYRQTTTHKTN